MPFRASVRRDTSLDVMTAKQYKYAPFAGAYLYLLGGPVGTCTRVLRFLFELSTYLFRLKS